MRLIKATLLTTSLFFQVFPVFSQQLHIAKTTIIGGKVPYNIKQMLPTTDGGVFFVAHTKDSTGTGDLPLCANPTFDLKLMVGKIDTNGNKEWVRVYCDYAVQPSSCPVGHPGYAVGGLDIASPDLLLTKLDCQGNIQWQKRWGSSDDDDTKNVVRTEDGGYLVLGVSVGDDGDIPFNYNTSTVFAHADIVLIKTDSVGNKQWLKIYGSSTHDFSTHVFAFDNHYYVVASTDGFSNDHDFSDTSPYPGNSYCYLMKIDTVGNVVWSRSLGSSTPNDVLFDNRDTTFVLVTAAYSNVPPINKNDGNNVANYGVVKVSIDGQVLWAKHYGDALYEDLPTGIAKGPGNTYVIVGQSLSEQFNALPPRIGYYDGLVYWIDSAGGQIERKFFGTTEIEGIGKAVSIKGNRTLLGLAGGSVSKPYTEGLWFYNNGVTSGASFSVFELWPTGVSEPRASDLGKLKVYPNPTSKLLELELPDKQIGSLFRIYSQDGRLMKQFSSNGEYKHTVDISGWATGVYVITCSGAKNYLAKVQVDH